MNHQQPTIEQPTNKLPTSATRPTQSQYTWGWTALLWLLLSLWLVLLLPFLEALPWSTQLAPWILPTTIAAGFLFYLCSQIIVRRDRRSHTTPTLLMGEGAGDDVSSFPALPLLLLVALLAGAALSLHNATVAQLEAGGILLGAFACVLGALLPWVVFRTRQPLPVLAVCWLVIAGAWSQATTLPLAATTGNTSSSTNGNSLSLLPTFIGSRWLVLLQLPARFPLLYLGGLLALSLLMIGVEHMRSEQLIWRALKLQQIGAVRWQGVRALAIFTLVVGLLALVPMQLLYLSPLRQFWSSGPGAQPGWLPYAGVNGTPVAEAGAPLGLTVPATGDNRILYRYTILSGQPQQTPLLAATFDTYDQSAGLWEQSAPAASVTPTTALPLPPGTQLLRARIMVETTASGTGINQADSLLTQPLLVGFSSAISFSVPAQAQLLANGDASTLTVADWRANRPLATGTTYETVSAVVPGGITPSGTLPTAVIARVTGVPPALAPMLQSLAERWTAGASTPEAQADALIQALRTNTMLADHAIPPAGQDPIAWFFKSRRGNGLMLISAFILLARSIGLPVRLAEGYLPGTYDPTRQDIIVRANDATVWAQLAIPGAGWLDLFPATNLHIVIVPRSPQPAPATPTPTAVPGQQLPFLLPGLPSLGNLNASQLTTVLLIVGAALLGVLLLLSLWLFLRWSLLGRKLPPVARFFVRVATLARLAGIPLPASDTAAEATAKVTKHLSLPQAQTLTRLNQTYEHLSYGPAPATVVAGPKSATNTTGQSEFRPVQRSLWRLIFSGAARKSNKESGKQTRPSRTVKVQLSDKQTKLTKLRKRGAV